MQDYGKGTLLQYNVHPDDRVAVCCSACRSAAVCCSACRSVAVCCSAWWSVAVCCNVLQCVAFCGNVLQCVAVFIDDGMTIQSDITLDESAVRKKLPPTQNVCVCAS